MPTNCEKLIELSYVIEQGLRAPIGGISVDNLNYSVASHKMSIGQLAVHCTGWMQYFLSQEKWEVVKWTCVPVSNPLSIGEVNEVIVQGFSVMRQLLQTLNDDLLEVDGGEKGKGYIIYRLLIHAMTHANQMAYLRQAIDSDWEFGSHFGDMATAIIETDYSTTRDLTIRGF